MSDWQAYVVRVSGDDRQVDVARKVGVDQATISRWRNGQRSPRQPAHVAAFAHAYGRPLQEAYAAAGIPTEEEVRPVERKPVAVVVDPTRDPLGRAAVLLQLPDAYVVMQPADARRIAERLTLAAEEAEST